MHGANMKKDGISSTWERCVQFGNCSRCFVLNSVRYHFHRWEVLIPYYSHCVIHIVCVGPYRKVVDSQNEVLHYAAK